MEENTELLDISDMTYFALGLNYIVIGMNPGLVYSPLAQKIVVFVIEYAIKKETSEPKEPPYKLLSCV